MRPLLRARSVATTAAVAATALLAVSTGAPAVAVGHRPAGTGLDASTLSKGKAPGRAYLAGLKLTTKTGQHITVQLPSADAPQLHLLGNSPLGFVVLDSGDDSYLYTVNASGVAHKFWTFLDSVDQAVIWQLSSDGKRIVQDNLGRGDGSDVTVFSVAGKQIARHRFDNYGNGILDFNGSRVIIDAQTVYDWTLGKQPKAITDASRFGQTADIKHGALFLAYGPGDKSHLVQLKHTNHVAWSTKNFRAVDVSPNGKRVVGVTTQGVIQVRKMSNGAQISHDKLSDFDGIVWETNDAYLVVAHGSLGSTIVRCYVATEKCERTTANVDGQLSMSLS